MGVCSQTGQVDRRAVLPVLVSGPRSHDVNYRRLTILADHLLATGRSEGIHGQLAADSATQLDWDLILRQRAGRVVSLCVVQCVPRWAAYLMSSARAGVTVT